LILEQVGKRGATFNGIMLTRVPPEDKPAMMIPGIGWRSTLFEPFRLSLCDVFFENFASPHRVEALEEHPSESTRHY
jgi:hypothetical protein